MEKLKKLLGSCKCGVYLNVNEHRDVYQTAEKFMDDQFNIDHELRQEIGGDVLSKMLELNTIIHIQFYPHTPIGSYSIYHYDVDKALDSALETLGI